MKKLFLLLVVIIGSSVFCSVSARKREVLTYGTAESVGMNGEYLSRTIDSIANASIAAQCFPGCQILVARHGKIVHYKSYGYHTNAKERKVENNHLYDMASCTKVMAATICLMRLVEQKKLDLDKPISNYLVEFKGSNKENLTLREILTHQSGLRNESFTKLFLNEEKQLSPALFSTTKSEKFPYQCGDSLYSSKNIYKYILNCIVKQKVFAKEFKYSCFNWHLANILVERVTGRNYEEYLYEEFYKPLGVKDAMYNPRRKYDLSEIVPTGFDKIYYRGVTHGYVHDTAAGMLGGVSGNAGLFANAESLAPVLQMLLNGGEYNGVRYFKRKTIREWTSAPYAETGNHRGIGFDKRRLNDNLPLAERTTKPYYYAPSASQSSFGHSGHTGTMVWADPKEDLLIVFLSNRVAAKNINLYFKLNPRTKCHEAAYEAIRQYKHK
ncbi:MAG: serine hydrolase [Alistipes sp.]|nr:serine hydrolase [Alistipes sp.]